MKKMFAAISAVLLTACGGGDGDDNVSGLNNGAEAISPAPSSGQGADAGNPSAGGDNMVMPASDFLVSEFQEGTGEIQISRLALERASNADVRLFAQLMIDHHTQANSELAQLAQARNLALPQDASAEDQATLSELGALSGAEFDRAYMARNVSIHEAEASQYRAMLASLAQQNPAGTQNGGDASGTTDPANPAQPASPSTNTSGASVPQTGAAQTVDGTNGTNETNGTSGAGGGTGSGGTGSTDADLYTYVMRMQPVMAMHLSMAKAVNGEINPAAYLANAYLDGLAEIELSNLALQKASNAGVLEFARMMIDDHTRANTQIRQLAQTEGVNLPETLTAEQRAAQEDLSRLSGPDFDKAYMNHNVIVHALSVHQTEEQAENGSDPEVRAYAASLLPALQTHLTEAAELYQSLPANLLMAAYQDGIGEIIQSSLAVQRADDAEVRQYAQRMIADHTEANRTAMQLAASEGSVLPNEPSAETALGFMQIAMLEGSVFDLAYMENNVLVHQRAVALFEERAGTQADPELRAYAEGLLPVLTAHLQEATELRDRVATAAGDAGSDTGTGTDAGTGAGADAGAGADVGAGADAGAGADVGAGAGADAGSGTGVDAGIGTGADTGAGAGTDAGIGTGADTGADAGASTPEPIAAAGT